MVLLCFFAPVGAADAHYWGGCKKEKCKRHVVAPFSSYFDRVARCESGGRWFIATGNGYYGGIQFSMPSWRAVGGWGMPHQNSILEQKYRGVKLLMLQGRGAWPHCG